MRTPEQILDRIDAIKGNDFFGFQRGDLIGALPFEHAKPFLKDGATEASWEESREKREPLDCIKEYLPFAWDKANNQRGLSADRSVQHLKAWLWLAGHEDMADAMDDLYEFYGKPCLVLASELVGFDWRVADDGCWTNFEGEEGISSERKEFVIADALTNLPATA